MAAKKPAVKAPKPVAPVVETVEPATPDVVEPPVDAPIEVAKDMTVVRALPGDNYLTIGERYGVKASDLFALNHGAPITTGTKIHLK